MEYAEISLTFYKGQEKLRTLTAEIPLHDIVGWIKKTLNKCEPKEADGWQVDTWIVRK